MNDYLMEKKILMVCLGNICRSPLAQGIMEAKLRKYQIAASVDSAGTLSYHAGHPPDERAVDIAKRYQVNIASQVARKIAKSDYDQYDFIFTMDKSVYHSVFAAAPEKHNQKVHLFLEYAGYNPGTEVPDPYYSDMEAFDKVFKLVDDACEKIVRKWYPNLK